MRICLVTAFPPSGRQLNEYAFHIARELQRDPRIELFILADELSQYEFATDEDGKPLGGEAQEELPGFDVTRCWRFNRPTNPFRISGAIRKLRPDVVWFNLVFSTFGTQQYPISAFAGLCTPLITRALGYYTHVTLHHILEHVDFAGAGVKHEKLFRLSSSIATRALLSANSVSVLMSEYQRTLADKYAADNVLLGTHGIFSSRPTPPDFLSRGNPQKRILAIGHWGTYKRLETLIESFPAVLAREPNARLVIAGANHHTTPGYWESIRESQKGNPNIEFRGYVAEDDIPELFRTTSILVLPYNSTTGSSGPAHQACQYGVPIVCADIPEFRSMVADEDMAVRFYRVGDAGDLANKLSSLLLSDEDQHTMAAHNFSAAVRMTMPNVVRQYLRWFQLEQCKRTLELIDENDLGMGWNSESLGREEVPQPELNADTTLVAESTSNNG
jgi:glycosyltransferase involved in cell wall biosynthesis